MQFNLFSIPLGSHQNRTGKSNISEHYSGLKSWRGNQTQNYDVRLGDFATSAQGNITERSLQFHYLQKSWNSRGDLYSNVEEPEP